MKRLLLLLLLTVPLHAQQDLEPKQTEPPSVSPTPTKPCLEEVEIRSYETLSQYVDAVADCKIARLTQDELPAWVQGKMAILTKVISDFAKINAEYKRLYDELSARYDKLLSAYVQSNSVSGKTAQSGCSLLPLKPLPPLGCMDITPRCVCDSNGNNCRLVWDCVPQ